MQQISGIEFYQVDYDWETSKYPDSNTGEIVVNIDKVKEDSGLESGYINAYSEEGWIIQNLLIPENFPYPYISRLFDLGRAGDIKSINVYIQVSAEPVSVFEYSGALPPYPVGDTIYDAEGGNETVQFIRPQPPPPNVPGPNEFVDPPETYFYYQDNHPNVACCKNQCVQAAYANNLQYLENEFGTPVNDELICGFNGTPSNSLTAKFDVIMERKAFAENNGSATSYRKALEGFVRYTYFESLPISLKHQGPINGTDDITYQDVTSDGKGWSVSTDFIINEIKNGHAVAMAFNWYYGGKSQGGHMVQIIAAGKILGAPYIIYLDDIPQGNCDYITNIPTQTFLMDWNWDGRINLLNAPTWAQTVNGFPEIQQIVVMAADNLPPLKPSIPFGGELIMGIGIEYEFTTSTTDPNGDQISYLFDWGDGTPTGWIGPFDSGDTAFASHIWGTVGIYSIKVMARDYYGAESEWSDERICTLPKTKPYINIPIIPFLEQHPNLFPILRLLLRLM